MKSRMQRLAKAWLPPAILQAARSARGAPALRYSGPYPDWESAAAKATGYDASVILERVKGAALRAKAGEIESDRDGVECAESTLPFAVLAGIARAAMEAKGRLSLLDFGGALGSSYRQCRPFLSVCESIRWGVVEQEHFVRCGREHFQDQELRFHASIDECVRDSAPTVALLSGVLHYLPRPFETLRELMDRGIRTLVIDRTPMADLGDAASDVVMVQEVPPSIYPASYPAWVFGRARLLEFLRRDHELLAAFDAPVDAPSRVGSIDFSFGGVIMRRRERS